MGLAATAVEPIEQLGRGAAIFAGVGAACAAAFSAAAAMWSAAAALTAWRRFRPVPGPAAVLAAGPSTAAAAPGGDPILAELVMGLAAQVAGLDQKLRSAMAADAVPARGGSDSRSGDAAPGELARAVGRLELEQRAIHARIAAEAEDAEHRSKTHVAALGEAVLPGMDRLREDMAHLRRALADNDARLGDFEDQVFGIFRARDAGKLLRKLDAEASELFEKLSGGDERRYGTADAWRADYAEWRSRINSFWDILRGYRTSVEQPFAVSEADINRTGRVPDNALFAAPDMRFRYKMLLVVNERHMSFREDAFSFNERKGTLPDPAAPSPPQARRPHPAAG